MGAAPLPFVSSYLDMEHLHIVVQQGHLNALEVPVKMYVKTTRVSVMVSVKVSVKAAMFQCEYINGQSSILAPPLATYSWLAQFTSTFGPAPAPASASI